ncbi:hypothetical protein ACSBR2_006515 [Camellia fascicularis]
MGMVTTVKSEMRPLKHRLCSMETHPPVAAKPVKRSKRESCVFVIGEQPQPQPQPQPGQVFPSTTTTGAYNVEETAARAYDLAAIKYWGPTTFTNFPVCKPYMYPIIPTHEKSNLSLFFRTTIAFLSYVSDYETEMEIMQNVTKEEYLASLRRRSNGFSRGVSKYRVVARHHHNGRWEARIGRVFGNKYLYLGTYSTQEEAAHAYDIAAIEYRGINAVTNFDLSTYIR